MIVLLAATFLATLVCYLLLRWSVWPWLAVLASALGVLAAVAAGEVKTIPLSYGLVAPLLVLFQEWPAPVRSRWGVLVPFTVGAIAQSSVGDWPDRVWPGPGLLLLAVAGLALAAAGGAGWGRAKGTSIRWLCLAMLVVSALGIELFGNLLASWLLLPPAAALGLTALTRGRRGPAALLPQADEVDDRVAAAFTREHPGLVLPPVAIVIAAYNEADGIPGVLASLPRELHGHDTQVLVVDDGSKDGTAEAAQAACAELGRGHVVACPVNRGQGRALRLGYRIAREHGASYLVTTDADGQYSPDEIATVLAPVVEGRADFVTGSRRRGALENKDAVRQAGTYVFAWLATVLLGRHITDTSFGLRAMRAEVTATVTLNQPQYQASELLVGVFSHGFRYAEVPATMRVRSAGSSKKGGNLVYGSRYARVMLGSWWREGCPRPVAETAPALRQSIRDVRDPLNPADAPA